MAAPRLIKVDVISDLVCPWCFVGKRRLDKAIEQMDPAKFKFEVTFRPYQLDPSMTGTHDRQERLRRKFGDMKRIESAQGMLLRLGSSLGINFNWAGPTGNSLDAHRLIEYAGTQGKQPEVVDALFSAYHEKSQNLADPAVLISVGDAAGLTGTAEFVNSDALRQQVSRAASQASSGGISGVPFFIFNNSQAVSGAQDTEVFVQIFNELK